MGYRKNKLGLLVQLDPAAATKALLNTFQRYRGSTTKTAKAYGVSLSTMKRWVATLDAGGHNVRESIEDMRSQVLL